MAAVVAMADCELHDDVVWTYAVVDDYAVIYGMSAPGPTNETDDVLHVPDTLGGKPVVEIESGISPDWHVELVIPASVTSVRPLSINGEARFERITVDSGNGYYKSVDGCLYTKDGKTLMRCPQGRTGKVKVAEGTLYVSQYAFAFCRYITEVELPQGLLSIGIYAFMNCNALVSVNIPSTVRFIDEQAFYCCSRLTSVTVPNGVQRIGNSTFFYCVALQSIQLPSSLVEIGERAFYGCPVTTVYVAPGDAERIKGLLVESGLNVDGIKFKIKPESGSGWFIAFDCGSEDKMYYQNVEPGKVAKLAPCAFSSPAGKKFAGWRRADNGRRYDDGMLVFDLASEPGAVVVLEAVWEDSPR